MTSIQMSPGEVFQGSFFKRTELIEKHPLCTIPSFLFILPKMLVRSLELPQLSQDHEANLRTAVIMQIYWSIKTVPLPPDNHGDVVLVPDCLFL
jgi:hypothetical protein